MKIAIVPIVLVTPALLLAVACSSAPLEEDAVSSTAEALVAAACAHGAAGDAFGRGLVGCTGAVAWKDRASLCAAGYRPATAAEWAAAGGTPTHDYWTNDDLRYNGGPGACTVTYSTGYRCDGSPMRVCSASGTDAEGNHCNWTGCGLGSGTGSFGGCAGNTTAGTLCVPASGCADGTTEQAFGRGLVGCAGSVAFEDADKLCAPGYSAVSADRWEAARGSAVPTHDYWVKSHYAKPGAATGLDRYQGTSASCTACSGASCPSAPACPAHSPMHVCTPNGTDAEGNTCEWKGCHAPNGDTAYYGGCYGAHDSKAGAICAPREGCANGAVAQHFDAATEGSGKVTAYGCAGSVPWSNAPGSTDANSLCAPGYVLARADDWAMVTKQGNLTPTHNYWTADNLKWTGSATGTCSATTGAGNTCAMGPMRVCTPTGADGANGCTWANCGLNATTPNLYFGGCSSTPDKTAGALCVSYASYCPPGMAAVGGTSCTTANCYNGCRFVDGAFSFAHLTGTPIGGSDATTCSAIQDLPGVPAALAGFGCSRGVQYGDGTVWACRADLFRASASYEVIPHKPQSACIGPANPGYVVVRTHCPSTLFQGGASCPIPPNPNPTLLPNMGCGGPCLL